MSKVELDKAIKLSQGYMLAKMIVANDIKNLPKDVDSLALEELKSLAKENSFTVGEAIVKNDRELRDLLGNEKVKPLISVSLEKIRDSIALEYAPPFKAYLYSVMHEKPTEITLKNVMEMERHIGAKPFPLFISKDLPNCKVWFSASDSAERDFENCKIENVPLRGNVIVTGVPLKCYDENRNIKEFKTQQDEMRYMFGAGPIPYEMEKALKNYMNKALIKNELRQQFKPKWVEIPISRVFIAKETEEWTMFNCPKNSMHNGEHFCVSNKLIKLDPKKFREVTLRIRNDYDIEFRNKHGVEYSRCVYQLDDMFKQMRPFKAMNLRDNDGVFIRHGDVVRDVTTGEPRIAVVAKNEKKVVSAYNLDEKSLDEDVALSFRKECSYQKATELREELIKNGFKKNIAILNRRFPPKKRINNKVVSNENQQDR